MMIIVFCGHCPSHLLKKDKVMKWGEFLIAVNRDNSKKSLDYYDFIQEKLGDIYETVDIGGSEYFYNLTSHQYFFVDILDCYDAIFVSYAKGSFNVKNNTFDDGDLFYVDDMTKEQMLDEIIEEIES